MKCPNCQVYNLAGTKFDINCDQPLQTETTYTISVETTAVSLTTHTKHPIQNPGMPVLPTGKEITMRASIFARTKNDKIIEARWDTDYSVVIRQPSIPIPSQYVSNGVYL
jgi:hypothetical protein